MILTETLTYNVVGLAVQFSQWKSAIRCEKHD